MKTDFKFRTPYRNRSPHAIHCKCPLTQRDFIKNEETGELEELTPIPFYERIQSYADSTKLAYKLRQFSLGDSNALGCAGGSYGDFTECPASLQEILQSQDNIKRSFYNLPENVRAIFNNNFELFAESTINGTAERKILEGLGVSNTGGSEPGTGANSTIEGGIN